MEKSLAAMLAGMEIYNKPDFGYREETFSVLAVNAWELLLKARILQLAQNRVSSILVYERRQRADGSLSVKKYRRKNRSGTHVSIGLFQAFDVLVNDYGDKISPAIRKNLELLVEVRDNAVHFINKGFELEKRVQELGSACLRNYLNAVRRWFGVDLSAYNFFLMPLAFFRDLSTMGVVVLNGEEKKFLKYLSDRIDEADEDPVADFSLALRLEIRLARAGGTGPGVALSKEPGAIKVTMDEENIRQQYPWTYDILSTRLRRRYNDFKLNRTYHQIRRALETDDRFCKVRLLDPGNPRSGQKKFYNPNIVREFDRHYSRVPQSEGGG